MIICYNVNENFKIMDNFCRMDRFWDTSFDILSTKDVVK